MKKVLVAYSTLSGTTADVARTIAEELKTFSRFDVNLASLAEIKDLPSYDAYIIGGPMIVGWHRDVKMFLAKNQTVFSGKPLALFATAMSLTQSGETEISSVPVFVDPGLAVLPANPARLTFKEKYAAIPTYVQPMLAACGKAKPVSVALLGGRLDLYRLKLWAVLFVTLIIHAQPGEKRNWKAIKEWTDQLASVFS
ncbi:MAG: flavodoxin domain-containing protein [Anaerolineaceae bacterium]|nr:flavodoxin domain-containing protein [Anaerolineaceae bacterium]